MATDPYRAARRKDMGISTKMHWVMPHTTASVYWYNINWHIIINYNTSQCITKIVSAVQYAMEMDRCGCGCAPSGHTNEMLAREPSTNLFELKYPYLQYDNQAYIKCNLQENLPWICTNDSDEFLRTCFNATQLVEMSWIQESLLRTCLYCNSSFAL